MWLRSSALSTRSLLTGHASPKVAGYTGRRSIHKITDEIQDNNSTHALIKDQGGGFKDTDIEQYIGNFEDIEYLVQENVTDPEMAYNHFSYDVEKAWCDADLQRVVQNARKADKSITATSDPIYGKFETLAKNYLRRERQSCKDLENQ